MSKARNAETLSNDLFDALDQVKVPGSGMKYCVQAREVANIAGKIINLHRMVLDASKSTVAVQANVPFLVGIAAPVKK